MLAGPTGTGKTDLALRLAGTLGGEIVNYDSVQIYRGFDIGSAKPTAAVRSEVPHHLFDIVDAEDEFDAARYGKLARETCAAITARGRVPILAGGTFFYLRAFLSGLPEMPGRDERIRARIRRLAAKPRGPLHLYAWLARVDPVSAGRIPPADRHRVERALEVWLASGRSISTWERPSDAASDIDALKIGLDLDRPALVGRLDRRVEAMYRDGLVDETRALLSRFRQDARPFGTIGYREAVSVIAGTLDVPSAIAETRRRTRAYAKRQMTWLRSDRNVQWVPAANPEQTFAAAMRLTKGFFA